MINEAIRIIDGALNDGTIGLTAKLALLTLESGDTVSTPTIYNEVQHGQAARDAFPDDVTCVLVRSGRFEQRHPRQRPRQSQEVPITLSGIERNTDTSLALRRASYLLDAIDATLAALLTSTDTSLRQRNGWSLFNVSELNGGITSAPLTDTPAMWELQFLCSMNPPA